MRLHFLFFTSSLKCTFSQLCDPDCEFCLLASPEVSEIQLAETQNDSGEIFPLCRGPSEALTQSRRSTCCLPDVISMTVRASHFHPDVITFRWFCEGGELSPVASQASSSPRPNSEGFFSAFSQCKLPRSELEKGSTKVWVSVHHIALKQPITRETRGERSNYTKHADCQSSYEAQILCLTPV